MREIRATNAGKASVKAITGGTRFWLSGLLSLIFLALALRSVRLTDVMEAIVKANYPLLAVALGTVIVTTLAKAARWRALFYLHSRKPPFSKLFSTLLIGQLVNSVLPTRLGEIARAYLIGEIEGLSKVYALTTIVIEKALDGVMLALILAVLSPFIPLPLWLRRSGALVGLGSVALFLVMVLMGYQKDIALRLAERLFQSVPGLRRLDLPLRLGTVIDGLAVLRDKGRSPWLWGWSIFIWVMAALTNYLTFSAMGIAVPFLAAPFLLVVLHLGMIVPSSPGRVGIFHYLCVLTLSLLSIDRGLALSYGFVLHLLVYLPMTALGAFYLWKETYDLQSLVLSVHREATRD